MHKQLLMFSTLTSLALVAPSRASEFVIQISVDGLRTGDTTADPPNPPPTPQDPDNTPDLQSLIDGGLAPNFKRLQQQGAWTHNARSDTKYVYTLPNHTSMMTGRPVDDDYGPRTGHRYFYNTDPEDDPIPNNNLHENASAFYPLQPPSYIASTFDVAHDAGRRTALFHGKDKFVVFKNSWDASGSDTGENKIDTYLENTNTPALVQAVVTNLTSAAPANYTFLHIRDPDSAGHASGWGSQPYIDALKNVDAYLGTLLAAIENPANGLAGKTTVILSADHGGGGATDTNHGNAAASVDFTIPFYVWGDGVAPGDLYDLNAGTRADPNALVNPAYGPLAQPIRNGDGGNLALDLLGLGAIPGSSINGAQDLVVPEPASGAAIGAMALLALARRRRRHGH